MQYREWSPEKISYSPMMLMMLNAVLVRMFIQGVPGASHLKLAALVYISSEKILVILIDHFSRTEALLMVNTFILHPVLFQDTTLGS